METEAKKTSTDIFEIFRLCGSGLRNDEVMNCNGKYDVVPNEIHNGRAVYEKKNRVVRFTAARRWAILKIPDNIILVFSKYKNGKTPSDVKRWMVLNESFELVNAPNRFLCVRELASRIASRGDLKCLQTVDLALKYLIRNPDVDKYKLLKSSNERLSKEIFNVENGIELLGAIGFRHISDPEDGYRYDVNESIKSISMIRDIIVDVGQNVDAHKISTVYCDLCKKARIVKRFEVDARVFQEDDFPWQCKNLRRLGSCSPPDDELLKCAHDSAPFALMLESMGVRTRAVLAAQTSESLHSKISMPQCTLPICEASIMKARHGEIGDFMDHILTDCSEQVRNVLRQCEILTPKMLLSWNASALAGMLRTYGHWKDGEAPTCLDLEKLQSIAKTCFESAPWLEKHKYLPVIDYYRS